VTENSPLNRSESVSASLPPYYLPLPSMDLDAETVGAFEALFAEAVERGGEIGYALAAPKWQFLQYLAQNKEIALHGSGNPDIEEFEPRQSNDIDEFGNRCAIYAASDGLWPMYFAILDRDQHPMSLVNGCFQVREASGELSVPFYFFSISRKALAQKPWREGMLYLLPRATFERQPPLQAQGMEVHVAQWASLVPVKPLAKLRVAPEDFPFLAQIRGHDETVLTERARANPDGFPWLDEDEI